MHKKIREFIEIKSIVFILVAFCTFFFTNHFLPAQSKSEKEILKEIKKKNKKAPKITPPNGLWLRDKLFIDKTEVAVVHWQEYIHYLRKDSLKEYAEKQLPDTTVFNRVCHFAPIDPEECLAMTQFFSEPIFRFAPIVGISYEQAVNYCQWRSQTATNTYRLKNPKSKVRFIYRLPSEKEWEEAAQMAYRFPEFPYGSKEIYVRPEKIDLKKLRQIYQFDDRLEKELSEKLEYYYQNGKQLAFNLNDPQYGVPFLPRQALEWIYLRQPIKSDLLPYHMIGNVAEMVREKGISKGGSWLNVVKDATIKNRVYYAQQEAWLGFRCICEVIEE